MLIRLEIGFEDQSDTHSIPSGLCDINGSPDGVSQLEFIGFNGDQLHERHGLDQFLGVLIVESLLVFVPLSTFEIHSLDVGTMLKALLDVGRVLLLSHHGVESGLVKSPSFSTASGLHQSSVV